MTEDEIEETVLAEERQQLRIARRHLDGTHDSNSDVGVIRFGRWLLRGARTEWQHRVRERIFVLRPALDFLQGANRFQLCQFGKAPGLLEELDILFPHAMVLLHVSLADLKSHEFV